MNEKKLLVNLIAREAFMRGINGGKNNFTGQAFGWFERSALQEYAID